MNTNYSKKILAMILVVVMLVSILPMNVFAAPIEFDPVGTDDYYKVITRRDWELAPGINEMELILNNDAGTQRQVAHIVEVDLNNPYTKVIPGYKEMIPTPGKFGTQSVSKQAAYAEANGYGNVVAATNCSLSWYNSAYYTANPHLIGEPLGYTILDGQLFVNSQGMTFGVKCCIVINYNEKEIDGVLTPRPDDIPRVTIRSTKDALTGWEEQVIPVNFDFLVKDTNGDGIGENQYLNKTYEANNTKDLYHKSGFESRTFVGVKADGTLVVAVSDGRQAPYSTGFNNYEMADMMIKLGCIVAANCDGGGSTEFMSQRPGEDLKINCSLSDGGERPTTNSILIISSAPSDGEFARATLSTDSDYYTPGSSVQFKAVGSDLVGTKVDVPENVEWTIKEDGMGTIENGVFTSNGTLGKVTVQLRYNGAVVGSRSIEIVVPTALSFSQPIITIPFGKTAKIPVKATIDNGLKEVAISGNAVTIETTNNALGTFDGLNFTAVPESAAPADTTSTITITLNENPEISATAILALGKDSVVLEGFENGIDDWQCIVQRELSQAHRDFVHDISLATRQDGQVHDGNYSLRLETNGLSSKDVHSQQYAYVRLGMPEKEIILENARGIGFWLYVPEDNIQCWVQGYYQYDTNGDGVFDTMAEVNLMNSENVYYNIDESGWHYMYMDLSDYEKVQLGGKWNPDPSNLAASASADFFMAIIFHKAINNQLWQTNGSINGPFTYYIDNITVDYSEAVEDREEPVFGKIYLNNKEMKKREVVTTTSNILNATAHVEECTERVASTGETSPLYNYTGLDTSSAKVYVDGVRVPSTFKNGQISISNIAVADGYHRIKFEICDKAGNKAVKIRVVDVQSGVDASTVSLVPDDATLDRLLGGSVYWMNLKATDIETIEEVHTVIDLNSVNHWELDHMVLAEGFEGEYSIEEETNTATITITRTGENTQKGSAVLAKMPVRIVSFDNDMNIPGYNAATFWKTYNLWPHDLKMDVDKGYITFVPGYDSNVQNTFSNEEFQVDTEIYTDAQSMSVSYRNEKGTAHVHTEEVLEDLDPTCTEEGYKNRSFCEVCNSVVEWGTTIKATGHAYEFVDGVLTCTNGGELFNGIYTDGKSYVNGVVATDGWVEVDGVKTHYIENGVMLTGSHYIDNVMCTFDEDGVYMPDYKFTGLIEYNDTVMYFDNNEYLTGYQWIDTVFYNFDENGLGLDGEVEICGTTCLFEDGVSVRTDEALLAGFCGEKVTFVIRADGTLELGGEGEMADFASLGACPWWRQEFRYEIKRIVVGDNVTRIGTRSFVNTNITEVVFSDAGNLKEISKNAFAVLYHLESITVPYGVETIGIRAFYDSPKIKDIYLPATVKTLVSNPFEKSPNAIVHVATGSRIIEKLESLKVNYVTYEVVVNEGTCGEGLTWELYSDGTLKILGEGAMDNFTAGTAPWYNPRRNVKKVGIGAGVTTIGDYAFFNCNNLTEITFEEGNALETVGKGAIGNTGLTEITLPMTVKTLAAYALYNNALLETVFIPDGVRSIAANAFANTPNVTLLVAEGSIGLDFAVEKEIPYEAREAVPFVKYEGTCGESAEWELYSTGKLVISGEGAMTDFAAAGAPWYEYRKDITSVEIGAGVTTIGSFAFYNCENLETLTFAEGSVVETIGKGAIGYTAITAITLPETVKTLAAYALYNNASLETVYIPDAINSIYTNAFTNTPNVKLLVAQGSVGHDFAVDKNISYETREAVPFVKYEGECGENVAWELYSTGKLVISGEGAMTDFAAAGAPWYSYRKEITNVEIGAGIETIGAFSFYNCVNLESITFAEGSKVKTIGKGAIGYTAITEITLPDALKNLAAYALYNNASLATVYIPDGVTTIHTNAFANTPNVKLLVAEGSIGYDFAVAKNIPYETREGAPFVKYEGECGESATWELYSNGVMVISGEGAMTDYAAAGAPWYSYRDEITSVEIGAGVETIGAFSFYNCENLAEITFAQGSVLETIGRGAIGYTAITEITIPASVTTLVKYALYYNEALESVTFEDGSVLSSIESFAFRGTTALTTVTGIPAGATVSSNAFYDSAYVFVAPVAEVVETTEEASEEVIEEVVEETLEETPEVAE